MKLNYKVNRSRSFAQGFNIFVRHGFLDGMRRDQPYWSLSWARGAYVSNHMLLLYRDTRREFDRDVLVEHIAYHSYSIWHESEFLQPATVRGEE
jgi:hypothetical protein